MLFRSRDQRPARLRAHIFAARGDLWSRLVLPTATKGSLVPVRDWNRDQRSRPRDLGGSAPFFFLIPSPIRAARPLPPGCHAADLSPPPSPTRPTPAARLPAPPSLLASPRRPPPAAPAAPSSPPARAALPLLAARPRSGSLLAGRPHRPHLGPPPSSSTSDPRRPPQPPPPPASARTRALPPPPEVSFLVFFFILFSVFFHIRLE